ncbi:hypothetical protein U3516DRAFT_765512 [Neocallimastix sp. 'constans']
MALEILQVIIIKCFISIHIIEQQQEDSNELNNRKKKILVKHIGINSVYKLSSEIDLKKYLVKKLKKSLLY